MKIKPPIDSMNIQVTDGDKHEETKKKLTTKLVSMGKVSKIYGTKVLLLGAWGCQDLNLDQTVSS